MWARRRHSIVRYVDLVQRREQSGRFTAADRQRLEPLHVAFSSVVGYRYSVPLQVVEDQFGHLSPAGLRQLGKRGVLRLLEPWHEEIISQLADMVREAVGGLDEDDLCALQAPQALFLLKANKLVSRRSLLTYADVTKTPFAPHDQKGPFHLSDFFEVSRDAPLADEILEHCGLDDVALDELIAFGQRWHFDYVRPPPPRRSARHPHVEDTGVAIASTRYDWKDVRSHAVHADSRRSSRKSADAARSRSPACTTRRRYSAAKTTRPTHTSAAHCATCR